MKVTVLCFDLSDNAMGRAALLARALQRRFNVEIIGPARAGKVWAPMKDWGIPVRAFPWSRYPKFRAHACDILEAADGDVLLAAKARPTSFGLALKKKRNTGVPVIVDIDDWELGFYLATPWTQRWSRWLNFSNPNSLPFTWAIERRVREADAVIVSNRFLQGRFGGEIVYHCRDTTELDPARADGDRVRRELNLSDVPIVLFLGTPRPHKGIADLRSAFAAVKTANAHLLIVGASASEEHRDEHLTILGQVPFSVLPHYLAAADVVVIPQRETAATVGQMPAKIFDAMSMGRPTISTRVSDIPEVLGDTGYLVDAGNLDELAQAIDHVLANKREAEAKGAAARVRCKKLYDLAIMEEQLANVIARIT